MADISVWAADPAYIVHPAPGETIFNTWLRGLEDRPANHCGPIYIQ